MQSPKIFKIGNRKIQRKGLWPIAVSSGELDREKPLATIKQELMNSYRRENQINLAQLAASA